MAEKIDQTQVRRVAQLARLELSDDEVAQFSTDLSAIVEYIEKLNELDTEHVEPLAHCLPVHNVFREDVIRIARRFNFSCETCCAPQEKRLFFAVRQLGLRRFLDCLRVGSKEERAALMRSLGELDETQLVAQVFSHVGRWIFERLPR